MLLDRDVFSGDKAVTAEAVPALVVVRIAMHVVMKHARPAGLANEVPGLMCLSAQERRTRQRARLDLRAEFVAPFASSIGKIVIVRKLQADFVELIKSSRRS